MANHDRKGPMRTTHGGKKAPMKLNKNLKGDENYYQFSGPTPQKARHKHCTSAAIFGAALLAIATFTNPSAQAANILANPGFETSPALTGWSIHSTETW